MKRNLEQKQVCKCLSTVVFLKTFSSNDSMITGIVFFLIETENGNIEIS